MEIIEGLKIVGISLLLILLLLVFPFIVIKKGLRFLFSLKNRALLNTLSSILTLILAFFLFSLLLFRGCGVYNEITFPDQGLPTEGPDKESYDLIGLEGKLIYSIPDTIILNQSKKINIRISKENIEEEIILKNMRRYREIEEEIIPLSSIMKVDLVESSSSNKTIIRRINNSSEQLIDTTRFTEWVFEVTPIEYGIIELTVTVSQIRELELYGRSYYDIPVYEKEVTIYASNFQKQVCSGKRIILVFYQFYPL